MDKIDVIVAGHLCLDMFPDMRHVPLKALSTPGRLFEVGAPTYATGGAVSNTGLALHRLGVNVRLVGCVGDDLIGGAIIGVLQARAPSLSQYITTHPGEASSLTIILSPQGVDRIFLYCSGTSRIFGGSDIDFSLVEHARIFHLGYPSMLPRLFADNGTELINIFRQAKSHGAVTSLDTALPDAAGESGQVDWVTILRGVLPYTDIFVPSIEEIVFCLRRADYDSWHGDVMPHLSRVYLADLADELLALGCVIVGFKLGEMGLYLRTAPSPNFDRIQRLPLDTQAWRGVEIWSPAFQVDVVGTTGAGDAAYAGLLAALLRGLNPHDAARWACAVGACNVEAADALSGVRTWAETQSRLDSGWPTLPASLP